MFFDDRQFFPPSERKLYELREVGRVPHSKDLLNFAIIFGFFLWLVSVIYSSDRILDFFRSSFSFSEKIIVVPNLLKSFSLVFFYELIKLFLIVFGLLFLVNGLQTRFLFALKAVNFNLGRLFKPQISFGIIRLIFSLIVKISLWIGVGLLGLKYALNAYLFNSVNFDLKLTFVLEGYAKVFIPIFISANVFSLFIGVITRMFEQISFQHRHSMSRAELEAEYRETSSVAKGLLGE